MMGNDLITQAAQRVAELKAYFVDHERFVPLAEGFSILAEKRLVDIQTDRISEAQGLALSGHSGAGKSAAITHLLAQERQRLADQGYGDSTIISLRVPSPATLKFVGQMLLRALGYPIGADRHAWYIWDLVQHHLKERRVLFVHLDEAQDLASRGTKHELDSVTSMLKTLMTDPEWPVGIILSGTNELEDILNHDHQLARRMRTVRFESLSPAAYGDDILDLLENYCELAQLEPEDDVLELSHGERVVHAAANQFGIAIVLILDAIEDAYLQGQKTLNRHNFIRAYHRRTSCDAEFNPFVVPDFMRIDARQVFSRENRT